jgi:CRISPR-associated protein Csy2
MNQPTALLLLPRLKVQGANAISGPLSWGFPSPTAFIGFTHALERHFSNELRDGFGGVGIVCHPLRKSESPITFHGITY